MGSGSAGEATALVPSVPAAVPHDTTEAGSVRLATPHPPAPSPTRAEGEHDTSEGGDRQWGDSPPPERGRVASPRGRQRDPRVRDFGPKGRDPAAPQFRGAGRGSTPLASVVC